MALSNDLISQFVKATKNDKQTTKESTVYGTVVQYEGTTWVKLDGSDLLTPVSSTVKTEDGDRVTVLVKDHTATITGDLSSPAANSTTVDKISSQISEFEIVIADKVSTDQLEAETARIDTLISDNVTIKETLSANEADIDKLQADVAEIDKLTVKEADFENLFAESFDAKIADIDYATISDLEAVDAKIYNLEGVHASFEATTTNKFTAIDASIKQLDADKATISDLDAEKARIDDLEANSLTADSAVIKNLTADVADIDTLIFGSASGNVIQTSFANAVIAQLGNAQIKSAMIDSISASKISSGDIITNNVRVMSSDGSLLISDETIQISDDTRVRVQIGKDASNDYSINIWDADGNLMFSEGGITDSAIKEAIIRNDMVASDANISASKLNISSLFTEINNSTQTINSNKILIDADSGTLDVAFTQMSSDVDDLSGSVKSQGTQITAIQGQINSKVWQQDIDEATDELETQYSALSQTVDGINATVAQHTTDVTAVTNRVTAVEADLSGFETTVNETYATKTDLTNNYYTKTETEAKIKVSADSITSSVSSTYATKAALSETDTKATNAATAASNAQSAADAAQADIDDLEVGGRNLLRYTKKLTNWVDKGYVTYDEADADGFTVATFLDTDAAGWYYVRPAPNFPYSIIRNRTVTISLYVRADENGMSTAKYNAMMLSLGIATSETGSRTLYKDFWLESDSGTYPLSMEWEKRSLTIDVSDDIFTNGSGEITDDSYVCVFFYRYNTKGAQVKAPKLELGNKATDWTPAPEDVDSDIDEAATIANSASSTADNNSAQIEQAQTIIQQLSDSISTLVVDESGNSLMTQDGDRWLFSMGSYNETLNTVSNDLDSLTADVGSTKNTVDLLNQAVNDLGVLSDYIVITTYNDQPCIELGEYDSDFKLRITNTEIQFAEGTVVPAYLSNQKLYIEKAEVKGELQQGEFVWRARGGSKLGLIWKGATS